MTSSRAIDLLTFRNKQFPVLGLLFFFGLLLPLVADNYILRAFSIFYIYVLLGAGLSIVVIYAGLLDLGYIAFFAVGAYTYALLDQYFCVPFFIAVPIGLLNAAIFGLILGFPTLRVRGDYLALVTLGFGEIIRVLLVNIWGPHGITGISPPLSLNTVGGAENLYRLFYIITFMAIPLGFLLLSRIERSPLAQAWFAIRDNETAARSCGVNSLHWLLLAFALGTAFAGTAGVIFAGIQRYINPSSFILDESILVLSIVVIAGGPSRGRLLIAAGLLCLLPEVLRDFANYRLLLYGLILIIFVIGEEKLKGIKLSRAHNAAGQSSLNMQLQKPGIMPSGLVRHSKDNGWNLKVNHLTVNFNGVTAINDVSFSVELAGCIIGLIGPNGAGKTTLFNCIAGENQQFAGSISFPGMKGRHSPFMSARCGVGRTFQTPQLFESMTAFENIAVSSIAQSDIPIIGSLCGTMRWTSFSNKEKEKVNEIVRYLGLTEVANMKVNSLPLAMQRLIEIGRALALKPRVILLDEIASGLNSSDKNQLSEIIRQLCKQTSVGFLIVEHDMDFIMPLAEEILVIDAGEMIFRGSPSEVKANQGVIDAYLGGTNVIP